MADPPKPILFIAFANDLENPARNLEGLRGEFARIQSVFSAVTGADDSCELLANEACTGEGLVEPFYRNQVVIFHYAGHASPDSLLLQTADGHNAPASRQKFEDFLATQSRLRLVFLNACMTKDWAEALVRQGVCVVATSRCVNDDIARLFAGAFYKQIAQDRTIAEAFEVASKGCSSAEEHQLALRGWAAAQIDHSTDGLPWALYGPAAAAQWKLSDDAGDPTIGLPPLDPGKYPPPPDGPYVTIEGHQAIHARVFFGRNAEIRQLYNWATQPTAAPILLFYGQSGAGKSSLLRAGLQPRLDSVAPAQYIRRSTNLSADIEKAILAAGQSGEPWLASTQPSLIVLDQVEEAITQGSKDELAAFIDRLSALFAQRSPGSGARLILSFRKEYLAEISNRLKEKLPGLTTELFLERLGGKAVRQVVLGPVRSELLRRAFHLSIPDAFADFLAHRIEDTTGSVAIFLQIVLRRMWEQARKQTPDPTQSIVFSEQLYFQLIDDQHGPLQQFLDERLATLRQTGWQAEVDGGLVLDLLLEHTTDHMSARRRTLDDLHTRLYPSRGMLPALIEECKKLHLLSEAEDDGAGTRATTLSHDQLALVVRADWNLSQLPGARARRIIENRARSWGGNKRGDLLDGADLRVVERGLDQMRALDQKNHETEMLAASREWRRKRRQAWILWPSLTAVIIGCVFVLAQANRTARDRVANLAASAKDNIGKDDFTALLLSMQAAFETKHAWALRLAPGATLRATVQSVLAQSLQTDHESGRYTFSYLDFWSDDIGPCAALPDDNGRLLFRTTSEENREAGTTIRRASLAGKPVPDDLLAGSSRLVCDPIAGRVAAFAFGDTNGIASLAVWNSAQPESKFTFPWKLAWGEPILMTTNPGGTSVAFGFSRKSIIALTDLRQSTSIQLDPGVGVPADLAFSPDNSALVVTGPLGMTWIRPDGSTALHCSGDYSFIRFGRAGAQGFAAIMQKPGTENAVLSFWKLPLSGTCQPFDFYDLTEIDPDPTAIAFQQDSARFVIAGKDSYVNMFAAPASLTGEIPPARNPHLPRDLAPDLPSVDDSWSFQVLTPVYYLGISAKGAYYATHQEKESQIRIWPVQRTMLRLVEWKKAVADPVSTDHLLALACSELKVYLDEDDRFRVNPAAGQGVDLHALHDGCSQIPQPSLPAAH